MTDDYALRDPWILRNLPHCCRCPGRNHPLGFHHHPGCILPVDLPADLGSLLPLRSESNLVGAVVAAVDLVGTLGLGLRSFQMAGQMVQMERYTADLRMTLKGLRSFENHHHRRIRHLADLLACPLQNHPHRNNHHYLLLPGLEAQPKRRPRSGRTTKRSENDDAKKRRLIVRQVETT